MPYCKRDVRSERHRRSWMSKRRAGAVLTMQFSPSRQSALRARTSSFAPDVPSGKIAEIRCGILSEFTDVESAGNRECTLTTAPQVRDVGSGWIPLLKGNRDSVLNSTTKRWLMSVDAGKSR